MIAPGGAFEQAPAPKYYVEFAFAGHFAWTDLPDIDHDAVVRYSLAFLNHYVKADPADALPRQSKRDDVVGRAVASE